jgi:hypothetical protein
LLTTAPKYLKIKRESVLNSLLQGRLIQAKAILTTLSWRTRNFQEMSAIFGPDLIANALEIRRFCRRNTFWKLMFWQDVAFVENFATAKPLRRR